MDNPAGCPRAHPQAAGCPQAPQGPHHHRSNYARQRSQSPASRCDIRPSTTGDFGARKPPQTIPIPTISPAQPSTGFKPVTFPKSPVTIAEMRTPDIGVTTRGAEFQHQCAARLGFGLLAKEFAQHRLIDISEKTNVRCESGKSRRRGMLLMGFGRGHDFSVHGRPVRQSLVQLIRSRLSGHRCSSGYMRLARVLWLASIRPASRSGRQLHLAAAKARRATQTTSADQRGWVGATQHP